MSKQGIESSTDANPFPGTRVEAFRVEKAGSTPEQYEDAFAYRVDGSKSLRLRVAIADGATEAVFSGRWARMLSQEFVNGTMVASINLKWLERIGMAFQRSIDFATLPWYLQDKAGHGSFATLLGLTIDVRSGILWGVSIGDSCAVVVVDGKVTVFPPELGQSASFGMNPYLIGSNPEKNKQFKVAQRKTRRRFSQAEGISVYLMTDALGQWFVEGMVQGREPWHELDEVSADSDFRTIISTARAGNAMRNDDVTLVRIHIDRRLD